MVKFHRHSLVVEINSEIASHMIVFVDS